jgi:hypothetical protein
MVAGTRAIGDAQASSNASRSTDPFDRSTQVNMTRGTPDEWIAARHAILRWSLLWMAAIAAWFIASGCSPDIFDVTVDLKTQNYQADFGTATGSIPVVACDPTATGACSEGTIVDVTAPPAVGSADVELSTGCDAATDRCLVQASGRIPYAVDVFEDDAFVGAVASHTVQFVRVADVAYAVSLNSLTFDLPQIDIYVGPAGITRETDPGVVALGSTPRLAAGTTLSDGHLTVDDASPARATLEDEIRNQRPLTFLIVLTPQLEAGAPVPAGAIQVDVSPRLLIGLPR